AEGAQSMAIAAGALTRKADSATVLPFSGSFFYDPQRLTVASTSPPATGGVFNLPSPFTLDVNFNEPVNPSSVQAGDLVLSGILGASASAVTRLNGNTTARFTIAGMTNEGTLTASIVAGALTDVAGVPSAA